MKSVAIYSRKSALADNISSLSGGGGGGGSNPALGNYKGDKIRALSISTGKNVFLHFSYSDLLILSSQLLGENKIVLYLERKVDQLDQRLGQQESSNRAILEQIMKIQQEFKVPQLCS